MSTAPELRVLCRLLTSTPPGRLPRTIPSITDYVFRCRDVLSEAYDLKTAKGAVAETAGLVHKFKTILTTMLNGRSVQVRFAAVVIIKTVIDVGGWEVLKTCEPWVRGLVAIVQRHDPVVSRELAIVTLTRIYMLVSTYPTLAREVSAPTIPTFATACLSLVKPTLDPKTLTTPLAVVETVFESISTLLPHYPTTFRPFTNQLKTVLRLFIAPTDADVILVPASLRDAARRLMINLHHTAPKAGGSDDWARLVRETVAHYHRTADQVFRAVNETWEPKTEHANSKVDWESEATGGSDAAEDYPKWTGVRAGSRRLIGLLETLAETLRQPTRASVIIPVAVYMDIISRSTQLVKSGKQSWEQCVEVKATATREEKDELWSATPDIHVAALDLLQALADRIGSTFTSLVPEALDYITRVFKSGLAMSTVRTTSYTLLTQVLNLAGPTMPKSTVSLLDLLASGCCRDLQEHHGVFRPSAKINIKKIVVAKTGTAANADLFMKGNTESHIAKVVLSPAHYAAAETLLCTLLTKLPQQHLKPAVRSLLDQTAIATSDKSAMLASVLFPYRDLRGKLFPSILPFLSRRFPQDQGVEVLRTNMRTTPHSSGAFFASVEDAEKDDEETENNAEAGSSDEAQEDEQADNATEAVGIETSGTLTNKTPFTKRSLEQRAKSPDNVFGVPPASPIKRKQAQTDVEEARAAKRPTVSKPADLPAAIPEPVDDDASDSDGESVHLNMDLDSDDDE